MARIALHRLAIGLALVAVILAPAPPALAQTDEATSGEPWWEIHDDEVEVDLYFAWSSTCPHCRKAHPFVESLEARYPWLRVHWLQVNTDDPAPTELAIDLAASIGQVIQGVPTFMWCKNLVSGYDNDGYEDTVAVPIMGDVDAGSVSLPAFTVLIAAVAITTVVTLVQRARTRRPRPKPGTQHRRGWQLLT